MRLGILKGGIVFLSDLSRRITVPHAFDLVGARSYKDGTQPTEEVSITKDLDLNVKGKDVIIIEDIFDTGNTLKANGLVPRELITEISSRLVVNKAAMKMKHQSIQTLIDQFEKTLAER